MSKKDFVKEVTTSCDRFVEYVEAGKQRFAAKECFRLLDTTCMCLIEAEKFLRLDPVSMTSTDYFAIVVAFHKLRRSLPRWYAFRDAAYAQLVKEKGREYADDLFKDMAPGKMEPENY